MTHTKPLTKQNNLCTGCSKRIRGIVLYCLCGKGFCSIKCMETWHDKKNKEEKNNETKTI